MSARHLVQLIATGDADMLRRLAGGARPFNRYTPANVLLVLGLAEVARDEATGRDLIFITRLGRAVLSELNPSRGPSLTKAPEASSPGDRGVESAARSTIVSFRSEPCAATKSI